MLSKQTKNIKEKSVAPTDLIRIGEGLNKRLHTYADYLQKRTERLSIKRKRLGLFVFCLLFGVISICIVIKSFTNNKNIFLVHPITLPAIIHKSDNDLLSAQPSISEKEFHRIELFKSYMDSLQKSETGRYVYDSINKARPHLIDSILLLENMYEIQSSKK
jgi:hypothetical protein